TIWAPSPQIGAGTKYTFDNWSDGGAQAHQILISPALTTETANFNTSYLLTTAANPAAGGTVSISADQTGDNGYYPAGTNITLTPNPATGYVFSNWTGTTSSSSNPLKFAMNGPISETANFLVQLTINTSPQGLKVSVNNGAAQTTPFNVSFANGTQQTFSVTSPQTATGTRYTFIGWSDGTTATSDMITVSASTLSYTANFNTAYLLTTAASPSAAGAVAVNTPSPTHDGFYPAGTQLTLTANANAGYQLSQWTGTSASTANPLMITLNSPLTETADFVHPTTTTASYWPSVIVYGQSALLAASVINSSSTAPTGTVTFKAGPITLGVATLSHGNATYTTNGLQLPVGDSHIVAMYSGDSTNAPSSSSFEFLVAPASTTTTVTYSPNPAARHQALTFTATVTPQYNGTPAGTVTFYQNGVALGTVPLVNGMASYPYGPAQYGTYTIKAAYNGSSNFNSSTGTVTLTIQ